MLKFIFMKQLERRVEHKKRGEERRGRVGRGKWERSREERVREKMEEKRRDRAYGKERGGWKWE